jgi:hypothetical protein
MAFGRSRVFLVGALVAMGLVAIIPLPGLSQAGTFALATMVFAGVLWITEGYRFRRRLSVCRSC